jgi:hypothetical protein
MILALLAHPREALHKRHLVYCVRVMSVGCTRFGVELVSETQPTHVITPDSVCALPPEDGRVTPETYRVVFSNRVFAVPWGTARCTNK